MKKLVLSLLAVALFIFTGCDKKVESFNSSSPEKTSESILSSKVANLNIPGKKFVKTADINLEVKDAVTTTANIEQTASDLDGYVTESNLQSNIISKNTFPINQDSAREVKKYYMTNNISVKVPNGKMGQFLLFLNKEALFINSSIIRAEDVSLNEKALNLKAQQLQGTRNKLKSTLKGKGPIKSKELTLNMYEKSQSESIDNIIKTDSLRDKVNYSTINILIEEKPKIKTVIIANTDSALYNFSGLLFKTTEALKGGLYIVQMLIIGLFYIWPLVAVGIIIFVIYKRKKS